MSCFPAILRLTTRTIIPTTVPVMKAAMSSPASIPPTTGRYEVDATLGATVAVTRKRGGRESEGGRDI